MITKLKLFIASLLLICLFAPMSKCEISASQITQAKTYEYRIIDVNETSLKEIKLIPMACFLLPLLTILLINKFDKRLIRHAFVEVLPPLGIMFAVLVINQLLRPLWGSYLAFGLSLLLILVTLSSEYFLRKEQSQQ